jgi:hypothetical protein
VGCSTAFAVRPLAYHMGEGERGENRRERGPRTGVSRVSEAYRPPTVRCRPHRTHGHARDHQGRPILSRKRGRERKGGYGQERPQRTEIMDVRPGTRPWERPHDSCYTKPSKGVWMSHYVRLHELYTNTVDTVSKTRKNIPPLHELTLSLHVRNIKTAIFQRFQICVLRSRVTAA